MSIIDDIKAAMAANRKGGLVSKGKALYELNRWMGEESQKLKEEYARRKAAIDARSDDPREAMPAEVLTMVATAVAAGFSRSAIRVALGKQSLAETDAVIAAAQGELHAQVESGDAAPFKLLPTGRVHGKGWPMYNVILHETGETYGSVYLVTTANATEAARSQMRISPSPAGSQEILDTLFQVGVGTEMFRLGKD
jgi:hypothetical protein